MARKKWSEIRAKASPQTLDAAAGLLLNMRLRELREARGLTQSEVAERLDIRQVSVSKLEARSDVRVSTLRAVVTAMGGDLDIRATFPDAEYRLGFGEPDARVERVRHTPAVVINAATQSESAFWAGREPVRMNSWRNLLSRHEAPRATRETVTLSAY
jgi:transcriptional regulator with XRE-family HTH domain